ncbi:dual specificity mitogen-activated protein kinase kinase 6-like [Amphiura filiformis]|uniref:dual specificity mitogen-activated protein kinase kinase 6-like n=1 Tax=Amphiura filiformis TaxID=82378 RepID=UPI003B21F2F8
MSEDKSNNNRVFFKPKMAGNNGNNPGRRGKMKGPKIVLTPKTPAPPSDVKPPRNLDSKATISINGTEYFIRGNDLQMVEALGSGAYGVVEKYKHQQSGTIMAVKRIRAQVSKLEDKRILMDMDVAMRSGDCPYTVQFYGALFQEGDVWICMEVMDTCLDKFYKAVKLRGERIPEHILSRIAFSVVSALHYLQTELKVMHRDVKPSNILLNLNGQVKMCDFGISGQLVNSLAKTLEAGSRPYMAPERIDPDITRAAKGYDVKSDVWSLGITMFELATNVFPYEKWSTPFDQLRQVVKEDAPHLNDEEFSAELVDFVDQCLKKNFKERLSYPRLLKHDYITKHQDAVGNEELSAFAIDVVGPPGPPSSQNPNS